MSAEQNELARPETLTYRRPVGRRRISMKRRDGAGQWCSICSASVRSAVRVSVARWAKDDLKPHVKVCVACVRRLVTAAKL